MTTRGLRLGLLTIMLGLLHALSGVAQAEILTLDKAIEIAMQDSRSLQKAQFDRSASDWDMANSVSYWLPRVSYYWGWSKVDDETYDDAQDQYQAFKTFDPSAERTMWRDNYSNSISVIQPIFNSGAEIVAIHSAALAREAAHLAEANSQLELILTIKQAYYYAQKSMALVDVMNETLVLTIDSLKFANARFEAGQATRSDVLRWEAQRAGAEGNLVQYKNIMTQAMMQLNRIIGDELETQWILPPINIDTRPEDLLAQSDLSDQDQTAPLKVSNHPALQLNDTSYKLTRTQIEGAVGGFLPKVNFSYNYSWDTNDTIGPDEDTAWSMGVTMEIPLFQGLGAITNTGKSVRNTQSAKRSAEQYKRQFQQGAYAARMDIQSAKLRLASARKAEMSSRENLKIINDRTRLGITTNLQQLDAQLAYQVAQSDLIAAIADFNIALAEWNYVTANQEDNR